MEMSVPLEQRESHFRTALSRLGQLAENYAEARAAGDVRKVTGLSRKLDEAQREVRRAERRLHETRKRLGITA